MEIYVHRIPKNCRHDCKLNCSYVRCPLKLISDHDKQVRADERKKVCGKTKRIETMVDLFADLITRNDDRPFNEVWEYYFGDKDLGHKSVLEVKQWLNEEVEE